MPVQVEYSKRLSQAQSSNPSTAKGGSWRVPSKPWPSCGWGLSV
jgi:hypothetical protein